jgi:hypothetical protein
MALLTNDQVSSVIAASLGTIADVPTGTDNLRAATFTGMNDQQKSFFLSALKQKLNALPYYRSNGTTSTLAYYDVNLLPGCIDSWPTVGNCIDWVTDNQQIIYK